MTDLVDDAVFEVIKDIIIRHTGILFDNQHSHDLKRHIISACRDLKIPVSSCVDNLQESSFYQVFLETLIKYITIGETYFFRDKNLFIFLRDSLLPEIIRERRKTGKFFLRIWSAACSSGEEPYSLAMLIRYLLPDYQDWDIFILATDINQNVLDKAQEAVYSRWSFRDEPIVPIGQYFTPTPDNRMKIDESVKKMVRFDRMNLIRDTTFFHAIGPSSLDLILCRNVLMYFSDLQSHEVVKNLISSLRNGGYLVVSPQEIGILTDHDMKMLHYGSVFIHMKGVKEKPIVTEWYPSHPPVTEYAQSHSTIAFESTEPIEPEISIKTEDELLSRSDTGGVLIPVSHRTEDLSFDLLISEGRLSEAANLLSVSPDKNSQYDKQIEILIRAYAGIGEYDKALGWTERMVAIDSLNPRAYLLKAAILDEQGLLSESLQVLRQALYADNDYLPAHLAIAGIYSKLGKKDMARHHYVQSINILDSMDDDAIVEDTEGIPASKMCEMIQLLLS